MGEFIIISISKLHNNKRIRSITYGLLKIINKLIPKNNNQILFVSIPDFSDNAKAMFEYLINNKDNEGYSLIWSLSDKKTAKNLLNQGIKTCVQMSINGLVKLFRSKYVISTHSTFGGLKVKNQVFVNLWHGMPLKSMGFMDNMLSEEEKNEYIKKSNAISILLTTSTVTHNAMVSCFHINPLKVKITGQPRNDNLFSEKSHDNLSKLLKKDISKFKKIVFFTPTFRVWDDREEGVPKKKNFFNFLDYKEEVFRGYLEKNEILFLLKIHPQEEEYYLRTLMNLDKGNIILITSEMLHANLMDLYDILGATDILITDYSSVYFDFLLINKPIIFVPTDLKEYSESRGFILEPYDFWAPGPKATNFKDFLEELGKCIKNPDYYKKERKLVNDIVNKYQDNKSCERVYDLVFGKE